MLPDVLAAKPSLLSDCRMLVAFTSSCPLESGLDDLSASRFATSERVHGPDSKSLSTASRSVPAKCSAGSATAHGTPPLVSAKPFEINARMPFSDTNLPVHRRSRFTASSGSRTPTASRMRGKGPDLTPGIVTETLPSSRQ